MTAGAPRRSRLRAVVVNGALLACGTLVALGAAEVAVRVVAPQQLIQIRPDIWEPADSLGWVTRANVSTTINTGERTVHLYTDSNGMRVGAGGRREADVRVLLIGDSFMQALQVEHEESFAGLLEDGLSSRLGRSVAVWNAAVDGWDTPQYLIRVRQLLARERFETVVVALYLGNDIVHRRIDYVPPRQPTVIRRLRWPRRLSRSEGVDAILYPVNDVLKRKSHLFILVKTRLEPLRMRAGLTAEYFPDELWRRSADSPRWGITADYCYEIAVAARNHGAQAVFVLIPAPFAVDTAAFTLARQGFGIDSAAVDLDQPTRLLSTALEERRLTYIPVLEAFRSAAATRTLYGRTDRHLTGQGHEALFALSAGVIEDLLVHRRVGGSGW